MKDLFLIGLAIACIGLCCAFALYWFYVRRAETYVEQQHDFDKRTEDLGE